MHQPVAISCYSQRENNITPRESELINRFKWLKKKLSTYSAYRAIRKNLNHLDNGANALQVSTLLTQYGSEDWRGDRWNL